MKILSITATHRLHGNTNRILDMIENSLAEQARAKGIELQLERIFLYKQNLKICTGCRACLDISEENCPLKDDVELIRNKMLEADGYIISSPVYSGSVNGTMKNWLDRMAYNQHRPAFAGKSALIITTVGSSSAKSTLKLLNYSLTLWGIDIVRSRNFNTGALMPDEELKNRYSSTVEKDAGLFLKHIAEESYKNPSLYNLIVFQVLRRTWNFHQDDTTDKRFWQEKGWLEPTCFYFIPTRSNLLKKRFARLIGNAVWGLVYRKKII